MNFEYFIVKKIATSHKSFTRLIIRIAIAAIALCLAVMICATAMISGFKKEIGNKIFGFNGHIQIAAIGGLSVGLETPPVDKNQDFYPDLMNTASVLFHEKRGDLATQLTGEEYYEAETKGGIRHIQVYAIKPGIIKTKTNIEGIALKGIGDDFDWEFMEQFMEKGDRLNLTSEKDERGILISEYTANRLEADTGSQFIIHFIKGAGQTKRRLKVKGIFKTGLGEFDKSFALVDIRFLQELMGWEENQVGGFEVFVENLDDLETITTYILDEELPPKMDAYISEEGSIQKLDAVNIRKLLPNLFGWLEFQDINETIILSLMIAVCIINMITALLILILERTTMIGILKAVGASDWSIRKIFLYHAAYIVGLGLLWGNIIGITFCLLEDYFHFIKLEEENYYLSYAPIDLKLWTILALNIGTLVLTVVFLIIPTYLITKISPVKAIRFD